MKLFAVKFRHIFVEVLCLARFMKNVDAFSRFFRPKAKLFEFRCILEVSPCKLYKKKFWVHFSNFSFQKGSCLLMSSDAFWKILPCKVYEKSSGAFSRFMYFKMKLFAMKFRRFLDALRLQGSQ